MMLDRNLYDPALSDKSDAWLLWMSSPMATWFYAADKVVKWHGDLRIYATEDGYQRLVKEGPPVRTAMIRGFNRVAIEDEALDEYRKAFDKWLGRETW